MSCLILLALASLRGSRLLILRVTILLLFDLREILELADEFHVVTKLEVSTGVLEEFALVFLAHLTELLEQDVLQLLVGEFLEAELGLVLVVEETGLTKLLIFKVRRSVIFLLLTFLRRINTLNSFSYLS